MRFGTIAHKVLEYRYPPGLKRGPASSLLWEQFFEAELKEAMAGGFRDDDGTWEELGETGDLLFAAYDAQYGADEDWFVISAEQKFKVRIAPGLFYVGTIDGVWRHRPTKRLHYAEHKTTGDIWTKHLGLDEQGSSYWTYGEGWLKKRRIIKPEETLHAIIYNFLRRARPDERPTNAAGQSLNKNGKVSERQPSPLFARLPVHREQIARDNLHHRVLGQAQEMEAIRRGDAQALKAPSRFTCLGCPFRDPCEMHEVGADYELLLRTSYEQHDPYSQYELNQDGK